MDEERRKKIEAGKSKWAELQKKKSRRLKSNSSPNTCVSNLRDKSSADPRGTQTICNEATTINYKLDNLLKNQPVTLQYSSDGNENPQDAFTSVLDSSSGLDEKLNNSPKDISQAVPFNQQLQTNDLPMELVLPKDTEESGSSGSENSTITGNSLNSSQSESTTENESSKNSFPHDTRVENKSFLESADLPPNVVEKELNDSLNQEESFNSGFDCSLNLKEEVCVNIDTLPLDSSKENESFRSHFENLAGVETEKEEIIVDVEKIAISDEEGSSLPVTPFEVTESDKPSHMEVTPKDSILLLDDSLRMQDISSAKVSIKEAEEDAIPFLNADDTELVSLYDQKIKKYQDAIQQRDGIISQLSYQLESAVNANQAANSDDNSQVEMLKDEINLLHLKMKETTEMLEKQKLKNDSLEFETCSSQTEDLLSKCETGIQVQTSLIALLQNCDFKDSPTSDFLCTDILNTNTDSLHDLLLKLREFLMSQFSETCIQELISMLRQDLNLPEAETISEIVPTDVIAEKIDLPTAMKKLSSLNIVAKLIESLISLSAGDVNEALTDFSPSKFQSFFLKRLLSSEEGDVLPDASENESVVSDYNYAEVDMPYPKPVFETQLSVEKLKTRNISGDFCLVTEFLLDEMERICSFIPDARAQGDSFEAQGNTDTKCIYRTAELSDELELKKFKLHRSRLETRLKNLKLLDKELHEHHPMLHQTSTDSDTMTMSEDNIMMEELPLSCISLLSLTDSEYKGENTATDSDTNFSRKISVDMSRSQQEREFCIRCERNVDLLREKYENEFINLKEILEKSYNTQKKEMMESLKSLEHENENLKIENANFNEKMKLMSAENEKEIVDASESLERELTELKSTLNKSCKENAELSVKLQEMEAKLKQLNQSLLEAVNDKTKAEISLQNQIADLILEHEHDMKLINKEYVSKLSFEKKAIENKCKSSLDILKKVHDDELNDLKCQIKKEFEEREQNLLNEHSKTISMIEAAHCDESAGFQKKIEQLLEEKCELLSKTTQEYETILKKNREALLIICKQLLSKINSEKERVMNESTKCNVNMDESLSDAFDELNRSLEDGLIKFLNQNYFMDSNDFPLDDTEYLPIKMRYNLEEHTPLKFEKKETNKAKESHDQQANIIKHDTNSKDAEYSTIPSESSLDSDDLCTIHTEINKLQEEFQKDVAFYKNVNDQLHLEIKMLRKHTQELEDQKTNLELQLQERNKELSSKETLLSEMDAATVKGGSQLSVSDITSWQVQTAQTNSRLLHVLSDLVKTFLDIETDINSHLLEHGLIPSRNTPLNQHDDDTGQSVGSREDFNSLSLGECPNIELTEDGPDLSPRAWDVFIASGNYENDLEGEDVVLVASRRLRSAVDHLLNLLSRALENQQNQDMKLLLKRNEELSNELQEESQGRDAVHMALVTAESNVRKLESEKQRLEDLNGDLKDDYDMLKRELSIEKVKISQLQQEKESAYDEIHTLKEQCKILASRLGDPEKTENDKLLNTSGTCMHENSELLQENSRLSSEKHTVQKNLSKERQSFLDRLQQMEVMIEELNAEKDNLMEKKCKEIVDLKAEMEAMDKQLQSNRKFIEEQAQEREMEREEFIKEINKMQDFVREKEKIQSNEAQLTKEIESLEQLLCARIEDHKNVMVKKDEVEKELRQSVDKIRDLRDVIEELEKQLDLKTRTEKELKQKLANLYESMPNQDRNASNSDSDSSKNLHVNGESIQQLDNLKEQLASQSQEIEQMSQSQTLLHELRGQIHFLEAKVEQRARVLESSFLSSTSSPAQSGTTSPSGSQGSESLHIPCEDGWEMSPRSIHWLEIRRLEEKIGRLVHIDEEMLKKNKDLEQQFKKMKSSYAELQHENIALQEKLSEQLVQMSALKSHMDEQKHRITTPQKTHSLAVKIEELQDELETQIENNKRLINDLQETQATLRVLEEETHKKDKLIAIFQKCTENNLKQSSLDNDKSLSSDIEFSSIEEIQNQLSEKIKATEATEKDNDKLKINLEELKVQNASLRGLLEKLEGELAIEKAQVKTLSEEISYITENSNGTVSLTQSNCNTSNEAPLSEDQKDVDPQLSYQNRIKEKNLEILMLKASVTKLESAVRLKDRELELEQKRLEQDFNIVQDMMQQKERELATLHEETESQLKLEAEIESLEKQLSDQKQVEIELKQEIKELQSVVSSYRNLECEMEQKDCIIQNLEEGHRLKIDQLIKQLDVLKEISTESSSNIHIEELVKKIMELAKTYSSNDTNESALQDTLLTLLRSTMNSVLQQLKQSHEEQITSINKNWQTKISEEIASKETSFKSEKECLLKKINKMNEVSLQKDAYWQNKLTNIEDELKNEQLKREKVERARNELEGKFTNEIRIVHFNLESALKDKVSLEALTKDLRGEIEQLKIAENDKKDAIAKEYESQLASVSKTIKESFEKEKENIISSYQQKINQLEKELKLKLEQEKKIELKHNEELSSVQKYFEIRWANEIKKVRDFQLEGLRNVKDSNERVLLEKIQQSQEELSQKFLEDKNQLELKYKQEIERVKEKYEMDKTMFLEMKDKAVKDATDKLEKIFNAKLAEIQKRISNPESEGRSKWEEDKLELISSHRKEISILRKAMKCKYAKQLQAQADSHNVEIKRLEESYNQQVEEVHNLMKEARQVSSSKCGYSDCGSNRTATPSSDMTSSDEACSSCQEDMLSVNKHILVEKIHQDGKRVLSLVGSTQLLSSVKEAHLWLDERKWIINKLKTVVSTASHENLKVPISNLVEEVQRFRQNFEAALDENSDLKEKCNDLEEALNIQYSKLSDASTQLRKQTENIMDLESLLSAKTAELSQLKRNSYEMSRYAYSSAEKEMHTPSSINSVEMGQFRSADNPRSAEQFSLYQSEITSTPPSNQKIFHERITSNEVSTIPKVVDSPIISPTVITPPEANVQENEIFQIKEKLMTVPREMDIKLHGLYWVYRRSQSYNKVLIYQKKYLLMLLRGFQVTEKVTMQYLRHMDSVSSDSTMTNSSLSGLNRFRSVVFVVIALQRMKFYVRRWRLLARIPSSHAINVEIQSVFQNYSFLSPSLSPGACYLSTHSLASIPMSFPVKELGSSQASARAENKSRNSINPEKSKLVEYVHRLEVLQKQLGLGDFR